MLFFTWKASGTDPYRLYNGLDESYRPLGQPDAEPRPPRFPERLRTFLYACGMYAHELDRKTAIEGAAAAAGRR